MPRRFNLTQRVELYVAADGRCQSCGAALEPGWHADHRTPHSRGGPTDLRNGQALCPDCNLRKGARGVSDRVVYRPWQHRSREAALNRFETGERSALWHIHPGSGKTLAALDIANELFRRKEIGCVQVFVPRINLCTQFELDWKDTRGLYVPPTMGGIEYRDNNPPLIRDAAFGYVSTYASVVANPKEHEKVAQGKRSLLILDEAQILGCEEGDATRSAEIVEQVARAARFVIVMSGTAWRADGQRLLFGEYSEPDEYGTIYLLPDAEASYLEGVKEGYLRPFEAVLQDGRALKDYLDGGTEKLILSEMDSGVSRILKDPKFWVPLVEQTVEKVREVQQIDKRFCGLIGACDQGHARDIARWLEDKRKDVSALIAVSDMRLAQDNLRQFKKGKHDILITVAMAHVGYDYKPISVVCCLNAFRQRGWLDQFSARGMRVMPDVSPDAQRLWFLCPDDRRMTAWVDAKRRESEEGLRQRREIREGPGVTPQLYVISDVEATELTAKGMDPQNDLDSNEFNLIEQERKKYGLGPVPLTHLGRMFRDHGIHFTDGPAKPPPPPEEPPQSPPPPPPPSSQMTTREWEQHLRNEIAKSCRRADFLFQKANSGWSMGRSQFLLMEKIGKSIKKCSVQELQDILLYLRTEWLPLAEERGGGAAWATQ